MKHYLLTFDNDHGDEFNVTAQTVMDENEYNLWMNHPSGVINKDYEDQIATWQTKYDAYQNFTEQLKARNMYNRARDKWNDAECTWYDANQVPYFASWDKPKPIKSSFIYAYLGNYGECFNEKYMGCKYMKDLVEARYVRVQECSEQFFKEFQQLGLSSLSICNVFDFEEFEVEEDE